MRIFLFSDAQKIAQNMKFEDRWTRRVFGKPPRRWLWDTLQGGHILDNRRGAAGLEHQALVWLGAPAYSGHISDQFKASGTNSPNNALSEIDLRDLLLYNGLDALLEARLAYEQMRAFGYDVSGYRIETMPRPNRPERSYDRD